MQMKKLVLAGLLGGIVMSIWSIFSHQVIPVYRSSLQKFTNEEAVTRAILDNAPSSGTYYLPAIPEINSGMSEGDKAKIRQDYLDRSQRGPRLFGFVQIGDLGSLWLKLAGEGLKNLVAALLFAWLALRLGIVSMKNFFASGIVVGVVIVLSMTMSEWIWSSAGFGFVIGDAIDQVGGWLLAGLVIGKFLTPPKAQA